MIEEREQFLLENNLISYRGDFVVLHPHFTNCYWKKFNQKQLIESIKGDSLGEKIFRYLYDFQDDVYCIWCGERKTKFKSITQGFMDYCSKKCVGEYLKAKKTFTTLGWKHTEESKQKMKDNHADFSGNNNPFIKACKRNPDLIRRSSEYKKQWWVSLSDERRKEVSETFSKAQGDNVNFLSNHRNHRCGCFISEKMGRNFFFRSSWELFVCEFLEDCDVVKGYHLEKFCIPYISDGKKKHTRIDFYVETEKSKIMIEVKPKNFLRENIKRIGVYQQYCIDNLMNFYVVSKDRLNKESLYDIIIGKTGNENFKIFDC